MRALVVALVICGLAGSVFAQKREEDRVVFKSKTILRLDPQVVEGAVEGPRGTTVFVRLPARFGNMVQVRESFRAELLGSSADL
jgi:hypothetical protein